jgi:hypothetical protein
MRRISALVLYFSISCTSAGEGIAPPLDAIYYPTGLALSSNSRLLYVVNSDFDLQYNAGTLQSLDQTRVRALIPRGCSADSDCSASKYCDTSEGTSDPKEHSFWCVDRSGSTADMPCGTLGERSASERVTTPGRCGAVDLAHPPDGGGSLITDAVAIGAFATDAVVRPSQDSARTSDRIFIPVRGESSINWADVSADGVFDCGQSNSKVCDKHHRTGRDASDNSRGLVLPPEPFAIDATADASAILVTHQTQGAVSLLLNDWQAGPHVEFIFSGLPLMPIAAKAVPQPALVTSGAYAMAPSFLVAYETTPRIDLFRYAPDAQSTPARPYLELNASSSVTINSGGYDVRGLAIDDSERRSCEQKAGIAHETCLANCDQSPSDADRQQCTATCDTANLSQLRACANIPLTTYAASRSPASLLIGHTVANSALTPNSETPYFNDAISLVTGPSRIQMAHVINANGQVETRVLIVCFDSRRIAIFDPVRRSVEAWVTTGRGPQAIIEDFAAPSDTDEGHALALVGHFTDSYLGVVELDLRRGRSYGTMVLSLGNATPPRTSK